MMQNLADKAALALPSPPSFLSFVFCLDGLHELARDVINRGSLGSKDDGSAHTTKRGFLLVRAAERGPALRPKESDCHGDHADFDPSVILVGILGVLASLEAQYSAAS